MTKWRLAFLMGIILEIVLEAIDFFATEIPDWICIPFQILALVMIFGGLICRKSMRMQKE